MTVVLDGYIEHGDSLGNRGVLGPGDVQWFDPFCPSIVPSDSWPTLYLRMTAAGGIIHSEIGHKDHVGHVLQLWLNLPGKDKMSKTHYQDLLNDKIPVVQKGILHSFCWMFGTGLSVPCRWRLHSSDLRKIWRRDRSRQELCSRPRPPNNRGGYWQTLRVQDTFQL